MCLSSQIAVENSLMIQYHPSGSVFFLQFTQFLKDSFLYWGMILSFYRIAECREPEGVVLLFWFVCSECFTKKVVRSRSPSGIILRIAVSTGLMNLDGSRVTTVNSAVCVFFY